MARTYSRDEFYDMVWSKPVTHWAKEFGLSDVAIHKICVRNAIPTPPLGWWAKKAAGQSVARAELSQTVAGEPSEITIAGNDRSAEPPSLTSIREAARVRISSFVIDDNAGTNPIVARTIKHLSQARPDHKGLVRSESPNVVKCEVTPASVERLSLILRNVFQAIHHQGLRLVEGKASAEVAGEDHSIGFEITEVVKRHKHVLTAEERAAQDKWRNKPWSPGPGQSWVDYVDRRPKLPDWDYNATGHLFFEIERVYSGAVSPRGAFRDGRAQRVENMASDIAVGLEVMLAAKVERAAWIEARNKADREEAERRAVEARHRALEERRNTELTRLLNELDHLDQLRRLIALMQPDPSVSGQSTIRFVGWLQKRLEAKESEVSGAVIEDWLSRQNLFD